MPCPPPRLIDRTSSTCVARSALLVVAACSLVSVVGCGGGDGPPVSDERRAPLAAAPERPSETPVTHASSPGPTLDDLFGWAQWKWPELFPEGAIEVERTFAGEVFRLRSYGSGVVLGVGTVGRAVFGLLPVPGAEAIALGTVDGFAPEIVAATCGFDPQRPMCALSGPTASPKVSGGDRYALALATDGTVYGWGSGRGELWNGAGTAPADPATGARVLALPGPSVDISAGLFHAVAVSADGRVHGWGVNFFGALGDHASVVLANPTPIEGVSEVRQAMALREYTLLLRRDGTVWHWPGEERSTGAGWSYTPGVAAAPGRVARLSPGRSFGPILALAVMENGGLAAVTISKDWRDGPTRHTATLTPLPGWSNVADAACGNLHCLAVTRGGTVLVDGDNTEGQLGLGHTSQAVATPATVPGLRQIVAVAARGDASYALGADGRLWAWGGSHMSGRSKTSNFPLRSSGEPPLVWPMEVRGLAGARAIAAGGAFVVDGTGRPHGIGYELRDLSLGFAAFATTPFIPGAPVLTGRAFEITSQPAAAVGAPGGTVRLRVEASEPDVAVRWLRDGQPIDGARGPVLTLSGLTVADDGAQFVAELRRGDTVLRSAPAALVIAPTADDPARPARVVGETLYAYSAPASVPWQWGDGSAPVTGMRATHRWDRPGRYVASGPEAFDVEAVGAPIANSGEHVCALRPGGRVACWGRYFGEPLPASLTGLYVQALPLEVPELTDAVSVAAGSLFSCALCAQGQVLCWGHNESGQIGDGTQEPFRPRPAPVLDLGDATQIAAGRRFACATRRDGRVACWGIGAGEGSLGNTQMVAWEPSDVVGVTDAVTVTAGDFGACAVRRNGQLTCWGTLRKPAAGFNAALPETVAALGEVAAASVGTNHACALRRDRSVWCWGGNDAGQLGDGSTRDSAQPVRVLELNDAMAITAGNRQTCALHLDRRVSCWGDIQRIAAGERPDEPGVLSQTRPRLAADLHNVAALRSRGEFSCALRFDGSLSCWGRDRNGQSGRVGSDHQTPLDVRNGPFWR